MNVDRVIVRKVVTISPERNLVEAAALMRERHVGFLVVVEPRNGGHIPVGVLTDRDIVVEVVAKNVAPAGVTVGDAMTASPLVANEHESIASLLTRMQSLGVRRAPVVAHGGELVGVVSFDDILKMLAGVLGDMAGSFTTARSTERQRRL
jgi:CBS domain-containing protein